MFHLQIERGFDLHNAIPPRRLPSAFGDKKGQILR